MSENLGDAVLVLRADDQLGPDIDKAGAGAQSKIVSAGKGMQKAGAGMTLGLTVPIIAFGKVAADELGEIQKVNAQTDASLRRVGAGAKMTTKDFQDMAGALQKKSGIDDQAIQSGMNLLSTLSGINQTTQAGENVFRMMAATSVDMAEAMSIGPDAAAKQLAKSMAAAAQGTLLLPRGMKLSTKETNKLEKALASNISTTEKQALVADVLRKKFEGSASLTTADKLAILKDRFAGIGAALLENLLPYVDKLSGYIDKAMAAFEGLSPSIQKVVAIGLALLAALGPLLMIVGTIMTALPALGAVFAALTGPVGLVIAAVVAAVAAFVYLWRTNEEFRAAVISIWNQIREGVAGVLESLKATMVVWVEWAKTFWKAHGEQIMAVVSAAWNQIKTIVGYYLNSMKNFIKLVMAILRGDWGAAWDAIKAQVRNTWSTIKSLVSGAVQAIGAAIKFYMDAYAGIARTAWNAVKTAVKNVADTIPAAVENAISGVVGKLKTIGTNAGSALAGGIRDAINSIISSWNGLEFNIPPIKVKGKTIWDGASIGTPNIAKLAKGGIVTDATLALIGEGRESEAVLPLSKLDAMLNTNVGGGDTVNVYPQTDDVEAIARRVVQILGSKRLRMAGTL